MLRDEAKERLNKLATIIEEEADEAAENAHSNLKHLGHKFKGSKSSFEECKNLISSQVARKCREISS